MNSLMIVGGIMALSGMWLREYSPLLASITGIVGLALAIKGRKDFEKNNPSLIKK